jgi:hypothetical protein
VRKVPRADIGAGWCNAANARRRSCARERSRRSGESARDGCLRWFARRSLAIEEIESAVQLERRVRANGVGDTVKMGSRRVPKCVPNSANLTPPKIALRNRIWL